MHYGGQIAPSELIEFDNNLVGVKRVSEEGNDVKDVLMALALMEEITGDQRRSRRRKMKMQS